MSLGSVQAMSYHVFVWKLFGLYNIDGNPLWYRIYKFVLLIIFYIYYPLSIAMKLFFTDNLGEQIDILLILPTACTYFKGFVITRKRRELDELFALMQRMDTHIKSDRQHDILDGQVRGATNLVKALSLIYYSTVVFNITVTVLTRPKRFMWRAYYPFDWEHNDGLFWLYSCFQFCCTVLVSFLYSSLDVHGSAMYRVLVAHLDILGDQIQTLGRHTESDEFIAKQFQQCIVYHTYCVRYAAYVNNILSMHFFVQFGISGLVFCGSEFKISVVGL